MTPQNDLTQADKSAIMEALQAVKREMKPKSKNELIRIIGVLLMDKHMQQQLINQLESRLNEVLNAPATNNASNVSGSNEPVAAPAAD